MKTAYIQYQDNIPNSVNSYIAEYGFKRMNYTVKSFTSNDVNNWSDMDIKLLNNSYTIFVGGIYTLLNILTKFKIQHPITYNPHKYLSNYCNRNIYESTLKHARQLNKEQQIFFIKPLFDNKLFTGFVAKSEIDFIRLNNLPDNTQVLISEVINIKSEYRCYIYNKQLMDIKHYAGDFTIFPNIKIILDAIQQFENQPIAYSLDFAILNNNQMELIEINDFYGISYYGINPILYCKMLDNRWNQITQNKSLIIK